MPVAQKEIDPTLPACPALPKAYTAGQSDAPRLMWKVTDVRTKQGFLAILNHNDGAAFIQLDGTYEPITPGNSKRTCNTRLV